VAGRHRDAADILSACTAAWDAGARDGEFLRVGKDAVCRLPVDSIDYAVMERITASSRDNAKRKGFRLGVVIAAAGRLVGRRRLGCAVAGAAQGRCKATSPRAT
jgi:hypothetical protein